MIITNAKTARKYVAAWDGASPLRRARMFHIAAEAQCTIAGLAWSRGDKKGERAAPPLSAYSSKPSARRCARRSVDR